jgi:hypothetical protein
VKRNLRHPHDGATKTKCDQSHKILEFPALEWDERRLDFESTQRTVATASYWQVRQRIYGDSVGRWRNYKRFIGPLRDLHRSKAAARRDFGGERGIRTLEGLLTLTPLAGVRLRPLGHLSAPWETLVCQLAWPAVSPAGPRTGRP